MKMELVSWLAKMKRGGILVCSEFEFLTSISMCEKTEARTGMNSEFGMPMSQLCTQHCCQCLLATFGYFRIAGIILAISIDWPYLGAVGQVSAESVVTKSNLYPDQPMVSTEAGSVDSPCRFSLCR